MWLNTFSFIQMYCGLRFFPFLKGPRGKYLEEKILGTCLSAVNRELPWAAVAATVQVLSPRPTAMWPPQTARGLLASSTEMPKSPTHPMKSLSCYCWRKAVAQIPVTVCLLLRSWRVPSCPNLLGTSPRSPPKAPMRPIRGHWELKHCLPSLRAPHGLTQKGFPRRTLPPRHRPGWDVPGLLLWPAAAATVSAAGCTTHPCRQSPRVRPKTLTGARMTTDPPRAPRRRPRQAGYPRPKPYSRGWRNKTEDVGQVSMWWGPIMFTNEFLTIYWGNGRWFHLSYFPCFLVAAPSFIFFFSIVWFTQSHSFW